METLAQPGLLYTIAMFLVVLGVLVFVHEWGHYAAGRLFKVRVETFSIGFGRELFGWTDKAGTRWKISALPLGGYVKFFGDMNAASQPDPNASSLSAEERAVAFPFKPLWQRAIIVAAGPAINFLFAIVVFAGLFMIVGQAYTPPVVGTVIPDTPAARAGFLPGDTILEVQGKSIDRFEDIVSVVTIHPGTALPVVIERSGIDWTLTVTPDRVEEQDRFGNRYEKGRIGLGVPQRVIVQRGPLEAVWHAVDQTAHLTQMMVKTLVQIITGRRPVTELGGPIKIAQFSGQSAAMGLIAFVTFMAVISINLGFVNLLPVPMLDGGHLVLYACEGLRGRPVGPRAQEMAFMAGFALVISLMLFLTWNDLRSVGFWDQLTGLLG
jgi:regulator of sigma E protease